MFVNHDTDVSDAMLDFTERLYRNLTVKICYLTWCPGSIPELLKFFRLIVAEESGLSDQGDDSLII